MDKVGNAEDSNDVTEILPGMKGRYNWGAMVRDAAAVAETMTGDVISRGLDDTEGAGDSGLGVVRPGWVDDEVGYHRSTREGRGSRRHRRSRMRRAQRVYGKKYYLTRGQIVVAGVVYVGSVLILGSGLAGFWIWLVNQTGACG